MKIFTNKTIIYKVLIVLIAILILSLVIPNISKAEAGDGDIGGMLFKPILDFLVGVADWFMSFIQKSMFGMEESFIHIDRNSGSDFWSIFFSVAVAIVVVAGCVALTIVSAGGFAAGAAAIVSAIVGAAGTITIVGLGTFVVARTVTKALLPDDFYLPVIQLTPESIFSR